jgi:MFS family permease
VVDHFGARRVLIIGLALGGLSFILLGLHLSYVALIACGALLGLANSVYHPADYAILAAHMDETRMGRAFSVHTFAGFLGGAVAPAIMAALVATVGGFGALMVAGAFGPAVALLMTAMSLPDARADKRRHGDAAAKPNILTPEIIVLTIFFMLLGLSIAGISNFGVVALMSGYDVTFGTANLALTFFLGASAVGVLAGGYMADRTERHGQVAAACFAVNAAIVLVIAVVALPPLPLIALMTAAGFLGGVIAPSRDMLVRNAAPAGAAGRAFGIVSTGFNFSGILAPLLYGFIMDQHMPQWVFGASVVFMLMTVLLALVTDRKAKGPAAVH